MTDTQTIPTRLPPTKYLLAVFAVLFGILQLLMLVAVDNGYEPPALTAWRFAALIICSIGAAWALDWLTNCFIAPREVNDD